MKKLITIVGLLASVAWAADFSQMSTEDMMKMRGSVPVDDRPDFQNEMQKRMQSMSAQEQQKCNMQNSKGMGQGKSMKDMGSKCMNKQPTFEEIDLNNDGKIVQSELEEARAKRMAQKNAEGKMLMNTKNAPAFTDMDKNKDGSLDKEEFLLHQTEQMKKWNEKKCAGQGMGKNAPTFADIDTDKDGVISQEEFRAHQAQRMQSKGKCAAGNCP